MAEEGAVVVAAGKDLQAALRTQRCVQDKRGRCDVIEATRFALDLNGRIDGLVNNVGVVTLGGPENVATEDWDRAFEIKIRFVFLPFKHVLPDMRACGGGSFVNILSVASICGGGTAYGAYSASMAALNALGKCVAMKYAAHGIRCNHILLGLIDSPLVREQLTSSDPCGMTVCRQHATPSVRQVRWDRRRMRRRRQCSWAPTSRATSTALKSWSTVACTIRSSRLGVKRRRIPMKSAVKALSPVGPADLASVEPMARPESALSPEPLPTPAQMPQALLQKLSPVVMDIYAAGDFHRADMRTIARESGTSFRTIYKYFCDKEQLLFWFISHWLSGLYPAAMAPLNGSGSLGEKLLQVLKLHFEFYEREPKVGRIIFMTVPLAQWMKEPSYAQPEFMSVLLGAIRDAQAVGELRNDLPAIAILDAFNAMFNRTFLMWEYRGRSYGLAQQADVVFKTLWGGISQAAPVARRRR